MIKRKLEVINAKLKEHIYFIKEYENEISFHKLASKVTVSKFNALSFENMNENEVKEFKSIFYYKTIEAWQVKALILSEEEVSQNNIKCSAAKEMKKRCEEAIQELLKDISLEEYVDALW